MGGLDLTATLASLAGLELPNRDREGNPIVFDSYDMTPLLEGENGWQRKNWFYFTETELSPGAIRVGKWKAVFNLRGDNGAQAGSEAPAPQLGWRGPSEYIATVPAVYDLWQDPQERYDLFMNSFAEKTWTLILFNQQLAELMKSYQEYPPRKLQSEAYTGPMTVERFRKIEEIKDLLDRKGHLHMLEYASQQAGPSMSVLVHHTDAEREYAYDSHTDNVMSLANKDGWTIVDMKKDWKVIFSDRRAARVFP